jgi:hypothetical protein
MRTAYFGGSVLLQDLGERCGQEVECQPQEWSASKVDGCLGI